MSAQPPASSATPPLGSGSSAENAHRLFGQAIACQRQGRGTEAAQLYSEILSIDPNHAPALHLLGSMALQAGDAERACELIGRSVNANPQVAVAHLEHANALRLCGRIEQALASYDRALAIRRNLFEAHFNKGVLLYELRRLPEALRSYELALKQQPKLAMALFNRAVVLADLDRREAAVAAYRDCLRTAPAHTEALNNLGVLLLELERPDEALASLEQVVATTPRAARPLNNRGNALCKLGRFAEATLSFDAAIAAEPAYFEALFNRGVALCKWGSPQSALASFESALRLRPNDAACLLEHARTLIDLKRYPEGIACLDRLLESAPQVDYAPGLRLHVQGLACDWRDYAQRVLALRAAVDAGIAADFPFPFLSVADSTASQARCARTFAARKFPPAVTPLWRGKRYRHEKIRVAYVSGDFREHAVAALMAGVFEAHDRARFETLAVSLRPPEASSLGRRVAAAFDSFVDASRLSDRAIAALLREREIDIAVDLMGFTQGSRTSVLAQRPAPVQVNYLGYPGTMGAPYIDYIIGDEFLMPASEHGHFAEKVVWLPECFQANDDRRVVPLEPARKAELGLPEFGFVFCCFNNQYKVKPDFFDIWMRLLKATPASVLWLLAEERAVADNLRREAGSRGVESERLVFAGRVGYAEHLARLSCADLFLDTLPFNAGASASDALWAGVPVLTCAGEAPAARMAGSLLRALALPELVTFDRDAYEARALELAHTPALLSELRAHLARERRMSALFDTGRFCRHLESAYTTMWERAAAGRAPAGFAVPALPRDR